MIDGDGLTVMQKHILKFILLETLHREIYQKDIEEEFQIRKSTVTGILQLLTFFCLSTTAIWEFYCVCGYPKFFHRQKRIYLPGKC